MQTNLKKILKHILINVNLKGEKMKKLLMILSLIIVISFIASFSLIGCKEEASQETVEDEAEAVEEAEEEEAEEEVMDEEMAAEDVEGSIKVIYFRPEDKEVNEEMTRIFNETYPNVEVTLEATPGDQYPEIAVNNILAGEEGADIFLAWMGANSKAFYDAGGMLDLTGWDLLDQVPQACWDQLSINFDPATVGIPYGAGGFVAFYNMDTMNEYDLEIPNTYEELLTVCETLLDNGVIPMQVGGKDGWPLELFAAQLEGNYRDDLMDNSYLTMENWGGAAEQFKELWDKGYLDNASFGLDYATVEANFAAGQFPIYIGLTFFLGSINNLEPAFELDVGVIPMNKPGSDPRMCVYFDPMWSINVELAKLWIENYIDNYALFIEQSLWLPLYPVEGIDNPILEKELELLQTYENVVNYGMLYLPSPVVQQVHIAGLQDYFLGNITLEDYKTNVKNAYDEAIAE
jgi:raffinose/stachyose/melibiose transport system substrate-binding protein